MQAVMETQATLDSQEERENCEEVKDLCRKSGALSSICMNLAESVDWDESEAADVALPWSCVAGQHNTALFVANCPVNCSSHATATVDDECLVAVRAISSAKRFAVDSDEGGALQAAWTRIHMCLQKSTVSALKTAPTPSALCGMVREACLTGLDPV